MTRKREVIVAAALRAFLKEGYEGSSVNRIAEDAGVSIKTLYRHFPGKEDLFAAVMTLACAAPAKDGDAEQPWLDLPPHQALPMMADIYLRRVLSPEELALYRVVVRDTARFPAIGTLYHAELVEPRHTYFVDYAKRWAVRCGWPNSDWEEAAYGFTSLISAGVLTNAVLMNIIPSDAELRSHAARSASSMLVLIESGCFPPKTMS